jgi:O-antigen ligase
MYALPAVLAAAFIVLQPSVKSWTLKGILAGSSLIVLVTIFASGNRSGWLGGAVIIALLLFKIRNLRAVLFVVFLIGGIAYLMMNYTNTEVAKRRVEQTESGTKSDQLRIALVRESVRIALENPLVGVSPQRLNFELGRSLSNRFQSNWIDPHNVFAYIMAGSGLICFSALIYTGWALSNFKSVTWQLKKTDPFVLARSLMRMMLILWVVRGMFSREILYSPGFCIGIGLALGLCIVEYTILEAEKTAAY